MYISIIGGTMRKIVNVFLTFAMLLIAFTSNINATHEDVVAKVGEKTYTSLVEALKEADQKEVVLLKDVTIDQAIVIEDLSIVLDLNGHTITFGEGIDPAITIDSDSNLTVNDSSNSRGKITNNYALTDIFRNFGTLTINGGTFGSLDHSNYVVYMGKGASHTIINGGTINGTIYSNGSQSGQSLEINDGLFLGMLYLASKNTTTTINGGTFKPVDEDSAIEIDAGILNITGGTFTNHIDTSSNISAITNNNGSGEYKGVIVAVKPSGTSAEGYGSFIELNITGGSFQNTLGEILVLANQAINSIPGVTQIELNLNEDIITNNKIAIYDKSGISASDASSLNIKPVNQVNIGSDSYNTLEEAIASADKGDELTLNKNISLSKGISLLNKEIILNLNGYTIDFGLGIDPAIRISADSKLTVYDSSILKTGSITNKTSYSDIFRNHGHLTINSGTFGSITNNNYVVFMENGSSVTEINGGTINGYIYSNGSYSGQTLTVNGGTFNMNLYLASRNTVNTINGGTFTPINSESAIEIDAGNLTINGGTFINNVDTSTNANATTNTSGSGFHKGVIVASKPTTSSATSYGSEINIIIKDGSFSNTLGEILVLVNHSKVSVENVTKVSATIYEEVIPSEKIGIYDSVDLDPSDATQVQNIYLVQYVVVLDGKEIVVAKEYVEQGASAPNLQLPTYIGYNSSDWKDLPTNITSNTLVKAYYDVQTFTVTFLDHNGKMTKEEIVEYGKSATAPSNMERDRYDFLGWDKPFDRITSNIEVSPIYKLKPIVEKVESNLGELVVSGLESAINFTPEELAQGAHAAVEVGQLSLNTLDKVERALLEDFFKSILKTDNPTVVLLDITLNKVVGNSSTAVSEAAGEIELSFNLPKEFTGKSFSVIRIHNGVVEVLTHTVDPTTGLVSFKTDKFSTYGVVSAVAPTPDTPTPPVTPVEPNTPVTPVEPSTPVTPDQPTTPTSPVTPALPNTGVNSLLPVSMTLILLGAFVLVLNKKRFN